MSKNVLIIDDSISVRAVVKLALGTAGYELVEACDGRDALRKLAGSDIDLIICDLHMPHMNGIRFLRAVKKLPTYKFTPVIMLTTESSTAAKEEMREAGARAWVRKPFAPQQMLDAVAKLI